MQIRYDEPLPEALIRKIARYRVRAVRGNDVSEATLVVTPERDEVALLAARLLRRIGLRRDRLVRRGADTDSEDLLVVALNGRSNAEAILDLLNRRGGRGSLYCLPTSRLHPSFTPGHIFPA